MQDKERTGKQRKRQESKAEKDCQRERDLGYKRGILCALQWGRDTREVPEDWLRSSLLYPPPAPLPRKPTGQGGRADCLPLSLMPRFGGTALNPFSLSCTF